eukprot:250757-Chlamydomonas_euryale.AAC.2
MPAVLDLRSRTHRLACPRTRGALAGLLFRCPMCVQPMHTISGVALASAGTPDALGIPQIASAGLFVSGCVLALGTTRLAELAAWLVPPPIVRGVQLGVGLQVAAKGVDLALRTEVPREAVQGVEQRGGTEAVQWEGCTRVFPWCWV